MIREMKYGIVVAVLVLLMAGGTHVDIKAEVAA
ncbi:hypothetical protein ig2599ANME_0851 [groundwater metagenome]